MAIACSCATSATSAGSHRVGRELAAAHEGREEIGSASLRPLTKVSQPAAAAPVPSSRPVRRDSSPSPIGMPDRARERFEHLRRARLDRL